MGSTVLPWMKHPASGRELVRRAFDLAYGIGDLTFASYIWDQLVTVCLAVGDPLAEVETECENGLAFARRVHFGLVIELCGAQLGLIRTLRGLTPTFGCLDHEEYNELDTERRLACSPNLAFAEFYHWTRKLQARFFAGNFASAVDASLNADADRLLWTSAAMFESAEHRFAGPLGCLVDRDAVKLLAHAEAEAIELRPDLGLLAGRGIQRTPTCARRFPFTALIARHIGVSRSVRCDLKIRPRLGRRME